MLISINRTGFAPKADMECWFEVGNRFQSEAFLALEDR